MVKWDPNRPAVRLIRTKLRIVHEDPQLLVVWKPAGLLSVPTDAGERKTLLADVTEYVALRDGRKAHVGVVHRLDIDTTGLLVFATDRAVEDKLRQLFIRHDIDRIYDALVVPAPGTESGTVDEPISKRMIAGRRRVVVRADLDGQFARTHWRVLRRWPAGAQLEVRLETGRQHQIRIHLAHAGFPVLGDPTYYSREREEPLEVDRPMLHARRLGFVHPGTGKRISLDVPPPEDFAKAAAKLSRIEKPGKITEAGKRAAAERRKAAVTETPRPSGRAVDRPGHEARQRGGKAVSGERSGPAARRDPAGRKNPPPPKRPPR